MDIEFKKNDKVKYIGRGFIGFDVEKPYATFMEYSGSNEAYIKYQNHEVLVYRHEIKPDKKYNRNNCPKTDTWLADGGRCGWAHVCRECVEYNVAT